MSSNLAAWVGAIGTVISAILVAIVAVFQDKLRAWVMRPRLAVSIEPHPPDCQKIKFGREVQLDDGVSYPTVDAYQFRLRVENEGNGKAESVEVVAQHLSKRQVDGQTFKPDPSFLPVNLLWTHLREPFYPVISRHTPKHCDLAHICHPSEREKIPFEQKTWPDVEPSRAILSLDTHVRSYTLSHLVPPGVYPLSIVVAAANAKPVPKTLEIHLSGKWYDMESQMLEEGISIRLLD